MASIKSLADQIREELKHPGGQKPAVEKVKTPGRKSKGSLENSTLLDALEAFNTQSNKSMVHVRFDEKTVRLMNQFKMATGVDVSKLVAFSVKELMDRTPELKQIIKHFIQNTEL